MIALAALAFATLAPAAAGTTSVPAAAAAGYRMCLARELTAVLAVRPLQPQLRQIVRGRAKASCADARADAFERIQEIADARGQDSAATVAAEELARVEDSVSNALLGLESVEDAEAGEVKLTR